MGIFKQKATYWTVAGLDDYGHTLYNIPRLLFVRWEERQERVTGADGSLVRVRARVYSPVSIACRSFLYYGFSAKDDPKEQDGAAPVVACSGTPSVDGCTFLYTSWL